jgi:hypothetical protein
MLSAMGAIRRSASSSGVRGPGRHVIRPADVVLRTALALSSRCC